MAIKFEDKPRQTGQDKGGAALRARFATPIEADDPVNPDAASDQPFSETPAAEQTAGAAAKKPKKRR